MGNAMTQRSLGLGEARQRLAAELLRFAEGRRAIEAIEPVAFVVVIKGAALAPLLWRPGERPMCDVDLLVTPAHLQTARRALRSAGWQMLATAGRPLGSRLHRAFSARGPGGGVVDVHAHIAQRVRWPVPVEEVLSRAVPCTLDQRRAWRPCNEDSLLIAALNQAKDDFAAHGASCEDIARLIARGDLDWQAIIERARCFRARVATWLALEHARTCCSAMVPADVLTALRPRRAIALAKFVDERRTPSLGVVGRSRRARQAVVGPLVTDSLARFAASAVGWAAVRLIDAAGSTLGVE